MFDLAGLDDDDLSGMEDELGAARRRYRPIAAHRGRSTAVRRMVPAVPGVPPAAVRQYPLGFGAGAFIVGGATTLTLTARPQLPFQGNRLVFDVTRTNAGGTATGLLTITALSVGQANQLVSATALPAEAFRPDAVSVALALSPATPGIDITLTVVISAAPTAAGDRVDFSAMLIGPTIS